MKALLVFGSTGGNTRTVAHRIQSFLKFPIDVVDVASVKDVDVFLNYDFVLFFASTWGDGELQIDMEDFFVNFSPNLLGRQYAICELGNYYGYDDFEFGALEIMKHYLLRTGGNELAPPFCMDSLPHKDWAGLQRWFEVLNKTCEVLS